MKRAVPRAAMMQHHDDILKRSKPDHLYYLLPSFLPSFLACFLPSFLASFLPSFLPCFLPGFLPSFLASFLASFLPSWLPSWLPSFLLTSIYPSLCFPSQMIGHSAVRCDVLNAILSLTESVTACEAIIDTVSLACICRFGFTGSIRLLNSLNRISSIVIGLSHVGRGGGVHIANACMSEHRQHRSPHDSCCNTGV